MLIDHSVLVTAAVAVFIVCFAMIWPPIHLKMQKTQQERERNEEQPWS